MAAVVLLGHDLAISAGGTKGDQVATMSLIQLYILTDDGFHTVRAATLKEDVDYGNFSYRRCRLHRKPYVCRASERRI